MCPFSIMRRTLAKSCLVLLVSGCSSITLEANGSITKRYVGWLKVTAAAKDEVKNGNLQKVIDEARVERVKVLGLRIANGIAIGYVDDASISLPLDCRLVIVVKTIEQLRQIADSYPQLLKTDNLCVKPLDF